MILLQNPNLLLSSPPLSNSHPSYADVEPPTSPFPPITNCTNSYSPPTPTLPPYLHRFHLILRPNIYHPSHQVSTPPQIYISGTSTSNTQPPASTLIAPRNPSCFPLYLQATPLRTPSLPPPTPHPLLNTTFNLEHNPSVATNYSPPPSSYNTRICFPLIRLRFSWVLVFCSLLFLIATRPIWRQLSHVLEIHSSLMGMWPYPKPITNMWDVGFDMREPKRSRIDGSSTYDVSFHEKMIYSKRQDGWGINYIGSIIEISCFFRHLKDNFIKR